MWAVSAGSEVAAVAEARKRLDFYFRDRWKQGLAPEPPRPTPKGWRSVTPERCDGGDLLGLCLQNLVYRCDLIRGIGDGLLTPFKYFGVPDTVDYSNIPWRSGRFDPEALEEAVAVSARAENCYDHYRKLAQTHTLAFCCSQKHADHLGGFLRDQGLRVAVVHAGPSRTGHSLNN